MRSLIVAGLAVVIGCTASQMAMASPLTLFAEQGASTAVDVAFNDRCGGTDNFGCEYTVAEGRVGNRQSNGTQELQIFDRLNGAAVGAQDQAPNANAADFNVSSDFTLSYVAATTTVTFDYLTKSISDMVDLATIPVSADNPTGVANTLVLRVRNATLTGLNLDSSAGLGHAIADVAELNQVDQSDVGYLYLGGFDLTADWSLSGNALLSASGNGSGSAFQVKVTDLDVPPIPLPAGVLLLGSGLGLLVLRRGTVRRA